MHRIYVVFDAIHVVPQGFELGMHQKTRDSDEPRFSLNANDGADISYLLALVFTILFLMAWGMAKKAQGTRHHKLILVSMVSMIIYIVGYYYARSLGVLSFEGREGFGGPDDVYDNVFKPVLTRFLTSFKLFFKNCGPKKNMLN